jgi:hypothetical protein
MKEAMTTDETMYCGGDNYIFIEAPSLKKEQTTKE